MTEAILKRIDESLAEIESLKPTKPRGGKCPYPPCTKEREEYYQALYQNAQYRARRIRHLAMVCRPNELVAFRVAVELFQKIEESAVDGMCQASLAVMKIKKNEIALILGVVEGK